MGRSKVVERRLAEPVLLGSGAFALVRDDATPTGPVAELHPAPPPPPPPASRERAAVATARTYVTVLHAGDADTAAAIANPHVQRVAADRNLAEMFGAGYSIADRPSVGRCSVSDAQRGIGAHAATVGDPDDEPSVDVRCAVTHHDPVHVELGVEQTTVLIRVFEDGTIGRPSRTWQGREAAPASWAYSHHLRTFHAAEYRAACAPNRYWPGTVHVTANLALNAACAAVWAPLADEVVRTLRDGGPDPPG